MLLRPVTNVNAGLPLQNLTPADSWGEVQTSDLFRVQTVAYNKNKESRKLKRGEVIVNKYLKYDC